MSFSVTRKQITDAALTLVGIPFRHQGRDEKLGVDCVGLLVCIGRKIGYPEIQDITNYRRMPKESMVREVIGQNCDEIPIAEAGPGDFYLIRLFKDRLCHAAVILSMATDIPRGIQPMLIHAGGVGRGKVKIEPVSQYMHKVGAAYRVRGLID